MEANCIFGPVEEEDEPSPLTSEGSVLHGVGRQEEDEDGVAPLSEVGLGADPGRGSLISPASVPPAGLWQNCMSCWVAEARRVPWLPPEGCSPSKSAPEEGVP
mmetsp:Transcript_7622/g.12109  ORF Transcript_7622/g.12109 Transcript_7622/m.12109 type:complete len:103 (+) Transcript_7622:843-1151(+)